MRVADLSRYGIPKKIIETWRNRGLEYLLPLQAEAVLSYGLLENKNLLISAPTSTGKTKCGEMAAIKSIANGKKALLIVPLKALATELYAEYCSTYAKAGIKVIAVTGDYPQNRRRFLDNDYDIAITVYEMINSLTSSNLKALEPIGTTIFDELQLIGMAEKGLSYELVISKIRQAFPDMQLVGLIGGLDDCRILADWLGWPLLKSTHRPIELHKGVLCQGKFYYRRHNDCREGIEYLSENSNTVNYPDSPADLLVDTLKNLVSKNEQVLVFLSTRAATVQIARLLADYLSCERADSCLEQLADFPQSIQTDDLRYCLERGVAFHNADLSPAVRRLLETYFRNGEIRVIASTSTLALGVNFPSRNVFIESHRCYSGVDGAPVLLPILLSDYNQIAGRAGRLGHGDNFGRAILIAENEFQREVLWDAYIYGSASLVLEPFDSQKLAWLFLRWFVCGMARDEKDCRNLVKMLLRNHAAPISIAEQEHAFEMLMKSGFLESRGCAAVATALGKATAAHNISLATAINIHDGLHKLDLADNILSWIYYLLSAPDYRNLLISSRASGAIFQNVQQVLSELLDLYGEELPIGPLATVNAIPSTPLEMNRWHSFAVISRIVQPVPAIELERLGNVGWGRLRRIGAELANLLESVMAIGSDGQLDPKQLRRLSLYRDMFAFGVPQSCLKLAEVAGSEIERDHLLRLATAGISTVPDILAAGVDIVASIIPRRFAEILFGLCQRHQETAECKQDSFDRPPVSPRRINLNAVRRGNRFEITFGSSKISLQPKLFGYLQKLANCENPDGWIDKNSLDSGLNQVKYIYQLKKALAPIPTLSIESDRAGRYRLISREEDEPLPAVATAK